MPKYGIHYIVLQESIAKLKNSASAADKRKGEILAKNPFFANLGAVGPDLFFYLNDYNIMEVIQENLQPYFEFYEKYMAPVLKTMEKIEKTIEDGAAAIAGDQIATLVREANAIEQAADNLIANGVTALILDNIGKDMLTHPTDTRSEHGREFRGIFQKLFEPPLNVGYEEQDWYWFDMLHYRKTGDFAFNLVKLAESSNDEELLAYAYSYLSHIATDVTGHPYVNMICKAPYRISAQRHVTAENFMDQWKWNSYFSGKNTNNIRCALYKKFGFDERTSLPDKLCSLIRNALLLTFKKIAGTSSKPTFSSEQRHPLRLIEDSTTNTTDDIESLLNFTSDLPVEKTNVPGFPGNSDIDKAYRSLRIALRFLGDNKDMRPIPPPNNIEDQVRDLLDEFNDLFDPPPSLAPLPGNNCTPDEIFNQLGDCARGFFEQLNNWLESVEEFVRWGVEQIKKVIEFIKDVVTFLALLPINTAIALLQALRYLLQSLNYEVYLTINEILSLQGLTYPEPEIANSDVMYIKQLIFPKYTWAYSQDCKNGFPIMRQRDQSHLVAPYCININLPKSLRPENQPKNSPDKNKYRDDFKLIDLLQKENIGLGCTELPATTAAFYSPDNSTPDTFIKGVPFNKKTLELYAASASPQETRALYTSLPAEERSIGNSIDFTTFLISNASGTLTPNTIAYKRVFCNWNLDGDRGYGYKEWEGNIPLCEPGATLNGIEFENEDNDFTDQYPKIWPDAAGLYDVTPASNLVNEKPYAVFPAIFKTELAALNISEAVIPSKFSDLSIADGAKWKKLLPTNLKFKPGNFFHDNIYFVNGLTCSAQTAIRANRMFEKMLINSFPQDKMDARLIFNRSELSIPGDLLNDALYDYIYGIGYFLEGLSNNIFSPRVPVRNATTMSVIALLHAAMKDNRKIILAGHSQGAIITGNAVLAFAKETSHRDFLKTNVKLLHMEPEISPSVRRRIGELVHTYLQYVDTTEALMVLLSGIDYVDPANSSDVQHIRSIISRAEAFYNSLPAGYSGLSVFASIPSIITILGSEGTFRLSVDLIKFYNDHLTGFEVSDWFHEALKKHWMPNQLTKITAQIQANQSQNSVNVKNFFAG